MSSRNPEGLHERPEVLDYAPVPTTASFSQRLNAFMRKFAYVLMSAVVGFTSAIVFSGDWCFSATCAAFLSASMMLCLMIVDRKFILLANKIPRSARISVAILVGVVFGAVFRVDQEKAFRMAFDVVPPIGISNFNARMLKNLGPPGDTILLIRFRASRATMQVLLTHKAFERDSTWGDQGPSSQTDPLPPNKWPSVWNYVFADFAKTGGASWRDVEPMTFPELHRWNNYSDRTGTLAYPQSTEVLWDSESGRCYVLHTE